MYYIQNIKKCHCSVCCVL